MYMKQLKFTALFCLVLTILLLLPTFALASSVTLKWNPVEYATGYKVYYGNASRDYVTPKDAEALTTYTLTLDPGTWFFAVTAYNDYGESDYSVEVSVTLYTAIGEITATYKSTKVTLAWDAVDGAAGYRLKYGVESGVYTEDVDVGSVTTYDVDLEPGVHYFVIVPYDADGHQSGTSPELMIPIVVPPEALTVE